MAFYDVLKGGACPQIEVALEYQHDPFSGITAWTDITPYVVSYSRTPYRANEFDQPGPAQATIVLRNDDARFIPDNPSSPYFGFLKKYRRMRVRALWNGTIYNRFQGYVMDWPQTWASAGHDQSVTLSLSDYLFPLETFDLQGLSFTQTNAGLAVSQVLTAAGIVGFSVETGLTTIPAAGPFSVGSFAMQRVKDICATENGICYADGGGIVNFLNRQHRAILGTPACTIGDGPGEVPYTDSVSPQFGDAWTIVAVTPNGGTVQVATDTAAKNRYFSRTLNYPTAGQYLSASPSDALGAAQYIQGRYREPPTRVPLAELRGVLNPSLWPTILGLDINSYVVFRRRPLSNGAVQSPISLNQFVEGYGDNVTVGQDWLVSVAMSPADAQTFWVLGDSKLGVLESTTRLFY